MDNDNLSKIPVSELTPENLKSLKGNQVVKESPRPRPKPKKAQGTNRLPLFLAGIVLLIGVAVALFFIFRKPTAEPEDPVENEPDNGLEVVWEPSENSKDPSQEFYDHHQSIIDSPETSPEERFTSTLEIANLYIATSHYDEAETVLNGITREGLTAEQLFRLYGVYQNLYTQSENSALADEYSKLADEQLNIYWQSQPDQSGE